MLSPASYTVDSIYSGKDSTQCRVWDNFNEMSHSYNFWLQVYLAPALRWLGHVLHLAFQKSSGKQSLLGPWNKYLKMFIEPWLDKLII